MVKGIRGNTLWLLLLFSIIASLLVGGTCKARPLNSLAANECAFLRDLIVRPMAERSLSRDETGKFISWVNNYNPGQQIIAALALGWADDSESLALLRKTAEKPDGVVSGAAACSLAVRSNRGKTADEMFTAFVSRLNQSDNPYERMFISNRLLVDFPKRALEPIAKAARAEVDKNVQCEMLVYLAELADAKAAKEILKWSGCLRYPYRVSEGVCQVLDAITPEKVLTQRTRSTLAANRELRLKARMLSE